MALLTFQDQYQLAQEISGLSDATSTVKFKRDINTGGTLFLAEFDRPYNRMSKFTDMKANQQYYQLPEDAVRLSKIRVQSGTRWYDCTEIGNESAWTQMNVSQQTSSIPTYFFVKGFDEVGLFPIPSGTVTGGIELVYEPKNTLLSQDDFTSGTVTVTNASQTITHSAAGFINTMVGRWFQVTDGSDGNWYKISAYIDASNLTLENYYQGLSGNTKSFRIGEVMKLPEEFLEAPVDYAMHRHNLRRGNMVEAADFKSLYDNAKDVAKDLYGSSTSNQVIYAERQFRTYNPLTDTPIINV